MTFISVSFYLVIRKPLKRFRNRTLQLQNGVIYAVISIVNGVIIGIADKVYISDAEK